jgi:hypothetical protein
LTLAGNAADHNDLRCGPRAKILVAYADTLGRLGGRSAGFGRLLARGDRAGRR